MRRRDEDTEFAQQASEGIEPRGARREPGGPQPVQRGNGLVLNRLDGDRMNLLVSIGFEEPFRVGAVGLVAPHVRPDIMRREQAYRVTERLKLAGPVVSRPARLEHDRRRRALREERQESIARKPSFFVEMARPMRHGHLEDGLCEIDGDGRMLHVDSSSLWPQEAVSPLAP